MKRPRAGRAQGLPVLLLAAVPILAGLGGLSGAARPGSAAGPAPADPAAWHTIAGGDEVLALAFDPAAPERLWAGTEGGGLVVWDLRSGSFAQHLYPAPAAPAGNRVYDIAFAADGTPWLASSGGVTRAAGARWASYGDLDGLPALPVRALAVDAAGVVWAGSAAGIARLAPGAEAFETLPVDPYDPKEPRGKDGPGWARVVAQALDGNGDLWLAHGRGGSELRPALSVRRAATGLWDHVPAVDPVGGVPEDGPPTDQIMDLAYDPGTGRLWVATWGRGVVYLDTRRGAWRRQSNMGLCGSFTWAVAAEGGSVWAACGDEHRGRGLARWDGSAWQAWTVAEGLPVEEILAIAPRGDQAWLGSNGPGHLATGILPFDAASGEAGAALSTFPRAPLVNDITALLFEPDGTLWAGTRGAGLLVRAPEGGWQVHTSASTAGALPGDTITDLALRQGVLWVACTQTRIAGEGYADGGLGRLDLATGRWGEPLRAETSPLPDDDLSSLAVGPDGRLWIGLGAAIGGAASGDAAQKGDGVAIFDPEAEAWEFHRFDRNRPAGPPGDTVLDLAAGPAEIWSAASFHEAADARSYGGGVGRWRAEGWTAWGNGDAGLWTWSGDRSKPGSTASIRGDVRSLLVDAGGGVWAGTWGIADGGVLVDRWPRVDAIVNRFDGTRWTATVFPEAGWVSALAADRAGRVWAGATRGHALEEHAPMGGGPDVSGPGSLFVRHPAGDWQTLVPGQSGFGAAAVSALALDPEGALWVGTENAGLAVFGSPRWVVPSPTACPACPSPTPTRPRPSATATPTRPPVEQTPTPVGAGPIHLPAVQQRQPVILTAPPGRRAPGRAAQLGPGSAQRAPGSGK